MTKKTLILFVFLFLLTFKQIQAQSSFAYVGSSQGNILSLDISTNTVSLLSTVNGFLFDSAIHPDRTFVYFAHYQRGTVVMSTTTHQTSIIDTGVGTVSVAIHPSGAFLYVANRGANTLSVIDTNNYKVIDVIDIPGMGDAISNEFPFKIAVHPSGKWLYVPNTGTHSVNVVDTATKRIISQINLGNIIPAGMIMNQSGERLYVSGMHDFLPGPERRGRIFVIDTHKNEIIKVITDIEKYVGGLVLNSDDSNLYVMSDSGVEIINTSNNTVENSSIAFGSMFPSGSSIAFSSNENSLYVLPSDSGKILKINSSTKNVINITNPLIDNFLYTIACCATPKKKISFLISDFSSFELNRSTVTQALTITNNGNESLSVSDIAVTENFSQKNDCSTSLEMLKSCTITISFSPTDNTSHSGFLTFKTNESNSETKIPLKGAIAPLEMGGCALASSNSNNFKIVSLFFLVSIGFLFLRRKRVKN